MKVQTHLQAGLTVDDVTQAAQQAAISVADGIMRSVLGLEQATLNLGHNPTVVYLWYWPLSPPSSVLAFLPSK